MTSPVGAAAIAVALTFAQATAAPVRPDFSGTWTLDRSRSQSPEPITLDIKQTPTEFRIEATRNGVSSVRVYPIDPEAKPGGRGIDGSRSRAYWDGTKIVTEGFGNIQGQTVSIRESRSLNDAGTEMTVESLIIVQHGYSFGGTRNYGSAKDVFTRVKSGGLEFERPRHERPMACGPSVMVRPRLDRNALLQMRTIAGHRGQTTRRYWFDSVRSSGTL